MIFRIVLPIQLLLTKPNRNNLNITFGSFPSTAITKSSASVNLFDPNASFPSLIAFSIALILCHELINFGKNAYDSKINESN